MLYCMLGNRKEKPYRAIVKWLLRKLVPTLRAKVCLSPYSCLSQHGPKNTLSELKNSHSNHLKVDKKIKQASHFVNNSDVMASSHTTLFFYAKL